MLTMVNYSQTWWIMLNDGQQWPMEINIVNKGEGLVGY